MTMCSQGHRYTGNRCPICKTATGAERRPGLKTARWQKLRRAVIHRDDFQCRCCGQTEHLQVHHVERNGPDTIDNLITLCSRCHRWAEVGKLKIVNRELTLQDMKDMA